MAPASVFSLALLLFGVSAAFASADQCHGLGQCLSDTTSAVQTQLSSQVDATKPLMETVFETAMGTKDKPRSWGQADDAQQVAAVEPASLVKQSHANFQVDCTGCVGCLFRGECRDTASFEGATAEKCFSNDGTWCDENGAVPEAAALNDPGAARVGSGGRASVQTTVDDYLWANQPPSPKVATRRRRTEGTKVNCSPDEWSYADAASWGVAGCEGCGVEGRQSPIDLDPEVLGGTRDDPLADASMKIPYNFPSTGEHAVMFNDGTALRVNLSKDEFGTLSLNETDGSYKVVELGFFFPSEHKVADVSAAGEMEIVLRSSNESVIVSILLEEAVDDANTDDVSNFFSKFRHAVAGTSTEGTETLCNKLNLGLLSHQLDGKYWSYVGSTSQPPCSAALRIVMARPASVPKSELDEFRRVYEKNGRPVQSLGGRIVRGPRSFQ